MTQKHLHTISQSPFILCDSFKNSVLPILRKQKTDHLGLLENVCNSPSQISLTKYVDIHNVH